MFRFIKYMIGVISLLMVLGCMGLDSPNTDKVDGPNKRWWHSKDPEPYEISKYSYVKIKEGMTYEEVEKILGPGKERVRSGNTVGMVWQKDYKDGPVIISIVFEEGRVKGKSIIE